MVRSVGIEPTSNRVRTGSVSFQLRTHGARDESRTRCDAVDNRALNRRASRAGFETTARVERAIAGLQPAALPFGYVVTVSRPAESNCRQRCTKPSQCHYARPAWSLDAIRTRSLVRTEDAQLPSRCEGPAPRRGLEARPRPVRWESKPLRLRTGRFGGG